MNSIKDIKHLFYINLESRPDRKVFFENQMNILGLNATRFNAIHHEKGAIGCSLSHINVLKLAKEQNLEHVLVMEDDIHFLKPELFINNINNFLSNHKNFDVLLIAGNNVGNYSIIDQNCVKIQECQTTTGYLVKNHYFDKLINNFENGVNKLMKEPSLEKFYAVDQYWKSLQLVDKWYLLTPLSVSQKPNYSDIEKKVINYNNDMVILDKKKKNLPIIKNNYFKRIHYLPNTMNSIMFKR
jgi:glycosyl transferase family 25